MNHPLVVTHFLGFRWPEVVQMLLSRSVPVSVFFDISLTRDTEPQKVTE